MQLTRRTALAAATATFLAGPVAAQVGGTLTDGAANYVQQDAPTGESLASPTGDVFKTESTTPNQLFQNWWYYRVAGDTREYPFGTYARSAGGQIAGSSNYSGNTATYNWTDSDASSATRFTATYVTTLNHGAQTGTATLSQSLQINNPGPTRTRHRALQLCRSRRQRIGAERHRRRDGRRDCHHRYRWPVAGRPFGRRHSRLPGVDVFHHPQFPIGRIRQQPERQRAALRPRRLHRRLSMGSNDPGRPVGDGDIGTGHLASAGTEHSAVVRNGGRERCAWRRRKNI